MNHSRSGMPVLLTALLLVSTLAAANVKDNWNDFLHYTKIGRLDLAQGYGEQLIADQPDPTVLLELSEQNPQGYALLLKAHADSDQLRPVSGEILQIIEQGRYIRRTDPRIISQEIQRLSTNLRGKIAAQDRLKNAGEYAIPQMLAALANDDRKAEFSVITETLPMIGRPAIRPLTAALQTSNTAVKIEIIRALGRIGHFEPLPYLKLIVENGGSELLVRQATNAIEQIDPQALKIPAAELFFLLGERYYNRETAQAPAAEFDFANVWFWDESRQMPVRREVSKDYFNELMAMRSCEWALKADSAAGKAIGLWIAAYFRAESAGIAMPDYFGPGHADAMTYATTAGAEYLHQALERALRDQDAYVALQVVEAMAANAGEKSLLYRIGTEQPLANALDFSSRKVRYSAAVALAEANPVTDFVGSALIIQNLAEALAGNGADEMDAALAQQYAFRAVDSMYKLALVRNRIVNLAPALPALIGATQADHPEMQVKAAQVLAHLESPQAQRAIAQMALSDQNAMAVRLSAFASLALSAKRNANLLLTEQISAIYQLVGSTDIEPQLRSAAAGAYGALNLPSEQVKNLVLDQSKS